MKTLESKIRKKLKPIMAKQADENIDELISGLQLDYGLDADAIFCYKEHAEVGNKSKRPALYISFGGEVVSGFVSWSDFVDGSIEMIGSNEEAQKIRKALLGFIRKLDKFDFDGAHSASGRG